MKFGTKQLFLHTEQKHMKNISSDYKEIKITS